MDEIYNHRVKLYITAQRSIKNLFISSKDIEVTDEIFAIDRCKSRMIEMQSKRYLKESSYYDLHVKKS